MKKEWIVAFAAACAIALAGCKVVSEPEPIAVQSVTLNTGTLTLAPGDTDRLMATVLPLNADNRTVTWSSSDRSVAWVIYDGTVTAGSEGKTIITAQAGNQIATCEVTVKRKEVAVDSITLSADTLTLEVGKTEKLTATVMPDDADDKTVTWSSSDTSVATVGDDGTVTAVAEGTASITAKAGGKQATCLVTVKQKMVAVSYFTLDERSITLKPGARRILIATVYPDNADYKIVTWSSSNPEIATVENSGLSDGMITAISPGTAIITAQAGGNGYMVQCLVTVSETAVEQPDTPIAVTGVMLDKETLTLTRGETEKLTATVMPWNAEDKTVAWYASNFEVATVDYDGTVTAYNEGTATITALAGGIRANCVVTVKPIGIAVECITLDKTTLTLACGETEKLTATVTPNNADDTTVEWSSSNTSVAKVGGDGTVTAVNAGTATITATAREGKFTATCAVIVHEHSYSGGKCTVCGANPKISGGWIDENGVLTQYYAAKGTVIIPEGVTGIGKEAFISGGKLTGVEIPDSVTFIGWGAFNYTGLTSVTIPDSVTSIEGKAFYNCKSLTSVTIGGSVTSFGYEVFEGCTNLTEIQFKGTKAQWNAIERSDNVDITCIICSDGYIGVKEVPQYLTISGRTVTGYIAPIPTDLVIPDGVKRIGDRVFEGCTSLTSVTIPSSVTEIGTCAFNDCTKLKRVKYGGTLADWCGINFLSGTSNPLYYFPATTTIDNATELYIDDKLVTMVEIPNSVLEIKNYAFYYYYYFINGVTIPTSVTRIGDKAFYGCMNLSGVFYDGSISDWQRIKKGSNIFSDDIKRIHSKKDGTSWSP